MGTLILLVPEQWKQVFLCRVTNNSLVVAVVVVVIVAVVSVLRA
jgi:hypothetical protein